jgi:hypothetical protein
LSEPKRERKKSTVRVKQVNIPFLVVDEINKDVEDLEYLIT